MPIVPAAILFDLANGGDKDWGETPPYRELGYARPRTPRAPTSRWAMPAPVWAPPPVR